MICPEILRQRLLVEGIYETGPMDEQRVRGILRALTRRMGMTAISDVLVFSPDAVSKLHHGVGGFQAWAESGCSLYTWRESRLFTIDIYSCKGFDPAPCIDQVEKDMAPSQLDWRLV